VSRQRDLARSQRFIARKKAAEKADPNSVLRNPAWRPDHRSKLCRYRKHQDQWFIVAPVDTPQERLIKVGNDVMTTSKNGISVEKIAYVIDVDGVLMGRPYPTKTTKYHGGSTCVVSGNDDSGKQGATATKAKPKNNHGRGQRGSRKRQKPQTQRLSNADVVRIAVPGGTWRSDAGCNRPHDHHRIST